LNRGARARLNWHLQAQDTYRAMPEHKVHDTPEENIRLKHDIDAGLTGDKVKAFDPGMSPLGTDNEAGTPADPDEMETARNAPPPPA
jgi:hypothetical protein